MEMECNAKGKSIFVGHFISPVQGWVEKCGLGFRIDGRAIKKRGKMLGCNKRLFKFEIPNEDASMLTLTQKAEEERSVGSRAKYSLI
jgi:hypothetical protein